jgi:hypothetical protein
LVCGVAIEKNTGENKDEKEEKVLSQKSRYGSGQISRHTECSATADM